MKLTVLGGCGAWPKADQACSGFLIEQGGFRLLIDPGYSTFPALLRYVEARDIDAVFVSHGHPDHCVDLNPLLRARALTDDPPEPLPVYAPMGALDAVLALDRPGMLDSAVTVHGLELGDSFEAGPFQGSTWSLPHSMPNAGLRLTDGERVLAYTGDTGPSTDLLEMAAGADVYIAEASYAGIVPTDSSQHLSSASQAGEVAARAGVSRLMLTHLFFDTSPAAAYHAAQEQYAGPIDIAEPGVVVQLA